MHKIKKTIRLYLTYAAVVVMTANYPLAAMAVTADSTPTETTGSAVTEQVDPAPISTGTAPASATTTEQNTVASTPHVSIPPIVTESPAVSPPEQQSTVTNDTTVNATINNALNSNATTGNAVVDSNTTAGSATTGDATAVATLMNTVNSSVNGGGAEFATFVTDVVGDVHGDIMLYPMLLAAMLHSATSPDQSTITANTSASINNDINLNATSGNASVTDNTNAGNATTGSADTVANVMNIINSIIAANQSFVGTINIYGNLDGDILVAPDFLPQLLASNNGDSSTSGSSLMVSSDDTQKIINNIDLSALSGNATVADNTHAGNATTGDAKTNLVLLNLSGHQIVAKDSMLVFVNVLGQWVGLIVDSPEGATAAALGTGVTTNNVAPDLTIDVSNNSQIVNNIKLNSQSGDATVAGNTKAGSAATGNATASANVANISGSQLGLTGWFGVLFINVFGNWFGSFGVDTARGGTLTPGRGGIDEVPPVVNPIQPFQFIPHNDSSNSKASSASMNNYGSGGSAQTPAQEVAVEEVKEKTEDKKVALSPYVPSITTPTARNNTSTAQGKIDFLPFIASAFLIGIGVLAIRTILAFVRERGALA